MEEEVSVRQPSPEAQPEVQPVIQSEGLETTPVNTEIVDGSAPTEEAAKSPISSPKTPPKSDSPVKSLRDIQK